IDPAPLFHAFSEAETRGTPAPVSAAVFHASLAAAFARPAKALVESGKARAVALSGGCFQNALLLSEVMKCLEGVPVLIHKKVPANDGGVALGQALIAAAAHLARR
ncbi:MAG: carbamoyltransferase HypF, partial [Arenibacterium sp.]